MDETESCTVLVKGLGGLRHASLAPSRIRSLATTDWSEREPNCEIFADSSDLLDAFGDIYPESPIVGSNEIRFRAFLNWLNVQTLVEDADALANPGEVAVEYDDCNSSDQERWRVCAYFPA